MSRLSAASVAAAALLVLSLAPATAQTPPAGAGDPVVAKVNGTEIRRSELEAIKQGLPQEYSEKPLEALFEPLLREVIDRKLGAQAASSAKLDEEPALKARLEFERQHVLRMAYVQNELDGRLTDDVLRERYDEFAKSVPIEDQVRASHILVKTQEEAESIIAALEGGADFTALAKEKSSDGAAENGGDLGFFGRGQMVKPFADAAFEIKPGEISKAPVKTQFGFHVIKVTERRKSAPPAFEDVRDDLKQALAQQLQGVIAQELRQKATIEQFNLDGSQRIEQRMAPLPHGIQPVPRQ